jgi:hypothetical protein
MTTNDIDCEGEPQNPLMKLDKIHSFSRKQLTAENAEKVIIDNLCGLSELCGELKCFSSDQTGRSRQEVVLNL